MTVAGKFLRTSTFPAFSDSGPTSMGHQTSSSPGPRPLNDVLPSSTCPGEGSGRNMYRVVIQGCCALSITAAPRCTGTLFVDLSPCLKAGDSWAEHSGP